MPHEKSFDDAVAALGEAQGAWTRLLELIRTHYEMDELWTEGKATGKLANYRNEMKFRRGGKTLVTLYLREGFFTVCVILGKAEREKFDLERGAFSDYIRIVYDQTHTYHDGKWLGIEVRDETYIDDIMRLLLIKRKPNRKDGK
ncbi:MAG: DUF3788 domain-containing protein [Oscillospiraceae bacterium]|jgi:hypothetical protein|nr:DUF3788 domain-containing protein [Oscillospiraceae bacterium]